MLPFGLRADEQVKEKTEDRFCVVIELMPPMGIIKTVRRNERNLTWFRREVSSCDPGGRFHNNRDLKALRGYKAH